MAEKEDEIMSINAFVGGALAGAFLGAAFLNSSLGIIVCATIAGTFCAILAASP